jgi:hypothetical protein
MKKILYTAFVLTVLNGTPASAHPLGNYSTNQYWVLDLRGDEFNIHFQLDFAEIPSFKEMDLLDTDLDAQASEEEINAYVPKRVAQIQKGLELEFDGKKLPLKMTRHGLTLYKGSGDMLAFKIEIDFKVEGWDWPAGDAIPDVNVKSNLHENARGYREALVLLDGKYSIEKGPWEDGDYRYITLAMEDENENPLFQSFYNIFRLRLSDGPKPLKSAAVAPVNFKWTATARKSTDEATPIGVYEIDLVSDTKPKAVKTTQE